MGFLDSLFGRGGAKPGRLLITDVTRMEGDRVCIAALDGDRAIRLHSPHPREAWLDSIGGLAPGDEISAAWRIDRRYSRPHAEDARWIPASVEKTGRLTREQLTERLAGLAYPSVTAAFGDPAFESSRGNPAFPPGRGDRSLACLTVKRVFLRPDGQGIRADFVDAGGAWRMVPVEDLALRRHQAGCPDCAGDRLAERLSAEMSGAEAVLRIGLTRPFEPSPGRRGCYLQVNHIFPLPPRSTHVTEPPHP